MPPHTFPRSISRPPARRDDSQRARFQSANRGHSHLFFSWKYGGALVWRRIPRRLRRSSCALILKRSSSFLLECSPIALEQPSTDRDSELLCARHAPSDSGDQPWILEPDKSACALSSRP